MWTILRSISTHLRSRAVEVSQGTKSLRERGQRGEGRQDGSDGHEHVGGIRGGAKQRRRRPDYPRGSSIPQRPQNHTGYITGCSGLQVGYLGDAKGVKRAGASARLPRPTQRGRGESQRIFFTPPTEEALPLRHRSCYRSPREGFTPPKPPTPSPVITDDTPRDITPAGNSARN
jgi:hypothetical protein